MPVSAAEENAPRVLGGWSPTELTEENRAVLERALEPTATRATAVHSVRSQVVAGTNYEFEIDACAAPGHEDDGDGDALVSGRLLVRVFHQPWTSTTQVTGIVAAPQPAA